MESAAGSDTTAAQSVQVKGIKDPQMRSYRAVSAGLDAFDRHRKLAPAADRLGFRLIPTRIDAPAPMAGLTMKILGNGEPITLAVDSQGRFAVPRNEAAYADDAELVLNRKTGQFRTLVEVRTPGLPENVRRMGDLRLECQAMLAILKKESSFVLIGVINSMLLTADWCSKDGFSWGLSAPATLKGGRIVMGERTAALFVDKNHFSVPIGDQGWSDDALIELEYAAAP